MSYECQTAAGFAAGRARIRKQNEDARRLDFIQSLGRSEIKLTDPEHNFVFRIIAETDPIAPDIIYGDEVICDQLLRKYGSVTPGQCGSHQ